MSPIDEARVVIPDPNVLWNWVLARQGVYAENGLSSLTEVADRTLGLHAARIQTPFLTAAARMSSPGQAAGLLNGIPDPSLMTIRGVRRTLHVMMPRHASSAHAATLRYRMQNVSALARRASVGSTQVAAASSAILDHLARGGPARERELEAALSAEHSTDEVRLALKAAWESGYVAFHNASGSWDAQRRTFGLATVWHPTFSRELPHPYATTHLLTEYLERYGPVTVRDAAWWSALGQATVQGAFASVPVVRMRLPWASSDFYMTEHAWATFESDTRLNRLTTTGTALLGNEDCALKAYSESRDRYLGGRPRSSCFNSIGEVRPTIVKDGRVVGLWHWDRKTLSITYQHFRGATTATDRAATARIAGEFQVLLLKHLAATGPSDAQPPHAVGPPYASSR